MLMQEAAFAKLNLTLGIMGKREDGYHDLTMVMQSISLCDHITVRSDPGTGLSLSSNLSYLPRDGSNIAARAFHAFFRSTGLTPSGVHIHMDKHIPICAGMAGGSSDGAAVLRVLRQQYAPDMTWERLEEIAAAVGSDVPYCIRGGTALAQGRGELLTPLPQLPPCCFVVCKPSFSISTPEMFSLVKARRLCFPDTAGMLRALEQRDLEGVAVRIYNAFEDILPRRYAEVFAIKQLLLNMGAMAASMTGTGPTVFGLFREEQAAQQAVSVLSRQYPSVFFAEAVPPTV